MAIYRYDSTFEGFLTCVFDFYEQKPETLSIVPKHHNALSFFDSQEDVITDPEKAATNWLKANPGVIDAWVAGVTAFDGGDGMAAAKMAIK